MIAGAGLIQSTGRDGLSLKKEREVSGLHSMSSSPLKILNSSEQLGGKVDIACHAANNTNSGGGASNLERKMIEKSKSVGTLRQHSACSPSSSPSVSVLTTTQNSVTASAPKVRDIERKSSAMVVDGGSERRAADILEKVTP